MDLNQNSVELVNWHPKIFEETIGILSQRADNIDKLACLRSHHVQRVNPISSAFFSHIQEVLK